MTRWLRPLRTRIFLANAVVAVSSILAAVWMINRTVTAQADRELQRGLAEAGTLVDEYRRLSLTELSQAARLVADLPRFKAVVELADPPTVAPLAADYRQQLGADVLVVLDRAGRVLAHAGAEDVALPLSVAAGLPTTGPAPVTFAPGRDGILQLVTVPIWIDPAAPDVLGTLIVGTALDSEFASGIKRLTASDIAFVWEGRVRAGTLAPTLADSLDQLLRTGHDGRAMLGGEEYDFVVRPLSTEGAAHEAAGGTRGPIPGTVAVLRSRTERLRPLRALVAALGGLALGAVLISTMMSLLVAQTVTRPIRAITTTMRQMARSGDLSPAAALAPSSPWDDEDAVVLASTFNAMTASIARFQQEAAQRERMTALGRLSTVIAHEIRNPLMIIKAALRTLRRDGMSGNAAAALADIDEEVVRLNGLVNGVLDFARPIRFTLAPTSLSALCAEAAAASETGVPGPPCDVRLDAAADAVVTDGPRLRQALINVLTNARQAAASRPDATEDAAAVAMRVQLVTEAHLADRVRVTVRDSGPGVDADTLKRLFDPFFTTKSTGTGIGLTITRNIIEGLGGTIRADARPGAGLEVLIELPRRSASALARIS